MNRLEELRPHKELTQVILACRHLNALHRAVHRRATPAYQITRVAIVMLRERPSHVGCRVVVAYLLQ